MEGICVIMISIGVLCQEGQATGEKQLSLLSFSNKLSDLFENCSFCLSWEFISKALVTISMVFKAIHMAIYVRADWNRITVISN